MIFRETAVAQGISGEDLREKEGCFLVRNDSAAVSYTHLTLPTIA